MEECNGKAHREEEEKDTIEEGEATEEWAVGEEEEETEDTVNAPYLQSCAVVPYLLRPSI